jgi:tripartite-type tricarboxylate transporter receptor subunit TctC
MVPARTPRATLAALHGATVSVLKKPDVVKRLNDLGYVIVGDRPEEFATHIKAEIAVMAKLVKALRLSADAFE